MNRAQLRHGSSSNVFFRKKQGLGDQVIAAMNDALGRVFHNDRTRTIFIGVNSTTRLLANELKALGNRVSVVSLKSEARPDHGSLLFSKTVDPVAADQVVLTDAGGESARCLLAASPDGDRNVRICQTALDKFAVPVVIARLRLLEGITSWARVTDSGMSRISWSGLIQALVPDMFLSPALSRVAKADDREQICDIEVRLPVFVGRTIDDLPLAGCEALALTRNGEPITTVDDIVLEIGDVLTLIGMRAAMNKVLASFASL